MLAREDFWSKRVFFALPDSGSSAFGVVTELYVLFRGKTGLPANARLNDINLVARFQESPSLRLYGLRGFHGRRLFFLGGCPGGFTCHVKYSICIQPTIIARNCPYLLIS